MKTYRLIVIGGGAAGITTAMGAAGMGFSVALIEKNKIGGECSWTGCVPSKALIAAAKTAHKIKTADIWNIKANTEFDASNIMSKVRELVQRTADRSQTVALLKKSGVEIIFGSPQFIDKHTIEVNGEKITAKDFVITTGSSPVVPKRMGLDNVKYYTNQDIFSIDNIPKTMGIIGGGPIGIEMAQAFQRLGSNVTVFESLNTILPHDDQELTKILLDILKDEGIKFRLGEIVKNVRQEGNAIIISTDREDGAIFDTNVEMLLIAAGRKANVEGLELDKIGIKYSSKGIEVNKYLETNVSNIWACGDCIDGFQFSHISELEARTLLQNIFLPLKKTVDYMGAPWATFTDPELAHVGLTEQDARQKNISHKVYRFPLSKLDRAIVEQEDKGMIKIITANNGKILGMSILSTAAGELVNEGLVAMNNNIGFDKLSFLPHIYPSWGYGIQRDADGYLEDLMQLWYMKLGLDILRKIN